jgi:hypothetical protein
MKENRLLLLHSKGRAVSEFIGIGKTSLRTFRGKICRSKRDEATRKRRRQHKEELHNLYSSQNIIWVIK